jgi:arginine N-succinyltransferase
MLNSLDMSANHFPPLDRHHLPDAPIYVLMLPEEIRSAIEEAGENTRGALRILEQAGMVYLNQIDPFDGGPYYGCRVDEIFSVKSCARYRAGTGTPSDSERYLVSRHDVREYRAVPSIAEIRQRQIILPGSVFDALTIRETDQVDATPLEA